MEGGALLNTGTMRTEAIKMKEAAAAQCRKLSYSTISGRLRLMKVGEKVEFSPMTNEITLRGNCSRLKKEGDGEWSVIKIFKGAMVARYEVVRLK